MKKVTLKFPHNGRRITEFVTNVIDELDNDKAKFEFIGTHQLRNTIARDMHVS